MKKVDSFEQLRDELFRLYETGAYATALELVETNEQNFTEMSARTTFWKLCLLSLEERLEDALFTFQKGLDDGLWWAEVQFEDADLDSLRELPEFEELVARSKNRWEQEKTRIKQEHVLLLPDPPYVEPFPLLVALHGRNGDKGSNLEHWGAVRSMGWALLSPQSTQPLFPGSYCWDDPLAGSQEVLYHLESTLKDHKIDQKRIIIAGFSQGSGMAIYTALQPESPAYSIIGVGTWWADVSSIITLAETNKKLRAYFVSGEKDHALEQSREIQTALMANSIPVQEEMHAELGHEFPSNFENTLQSALEFFFEE